jgi:hypothetical protein
VLTSCRVGGAGDGATSTTGDGDVQDMSEKVRDLDMKGTMQANVGRSISSPARFRLVGLFRSKSRVWTPPRVVEENGDGVDRAISPSVLVKKKKQKMRVLG